MSRLALEILFQVVVLFLVQGVIGDNTTFLTVMLLFLKTVLIQLVKLFRTCIVFHVLVEVLDLMYPRFAPRGIT